MIKEYALYKAIKPPLETMANPKDINYAVYKKIPQTHIWYITGMIKKVTHTYKY